MVLWPPLEQEADLIESTVQMIPKELLFQHNLESAFKRKGVVRTSCGTVVHPWPPYSRGKTRGLGSSLSTRAREAPTPTPTPHSPSLFPGQLGHLIVNRYLEMLGQARLRMAMLAWKVCAAAAQ
jgi:hypothetical protein